MNGFALGVQYDGSAFHGFQRQEALPTVQASLEEALSSIADEPVSLKPAGRTDQGVHATQQVVSFQTNASREHEAWRRGVNSKLPETISVRWVKEVSVDFDARYAALWRRYLYVFGEGSGYQVFLHKYVTWINEKLDAQAMNAVTAVFLGEQDFSAIRAANCGSVSPSRYIYHLAVLRLGAFIVIDVVANAYLLHMVRNLASVLREVGLGRMSQQQVITLLASRDRTQGPSTASSQGLYLAAVGYETQHGIDETVCLPSMIGYAGDHFERVKLPADYYRRPATR